MSRNEIKIRKHRLAGRGAERFRNYSAVLKEHEQHQRLRKMLKVFTLFAIILILLTLLVIVFRAEKKIKPVANFANRESISNPSTLVNPHSIC